MFKPLTFSTRQLPVQASRLDDDAVHLWWLDLDKLPGPPGIANPVPQTPPATSSNESLAAALQQQRFLQRFYTRLILAAYLGKPAARVRIDKTPGGKPFVVPDSIDDRGDSKDVLVSRPPIFFSLSHDRRQLLLALCTSFPVGVDMETVSRNIRAPMQLAKRYFHPSESQWLEQQPEQHLLERWFALWTCKEAVVKATGGGIVSGMDRFAVSLDTANLEHGAPQITAAVNAPDDDLLHKLSLTQLQPAEGRIAAVAHHRSINTISAFELHRNQP